MKKLMLLMLVMLVGCDRESPAATVVRAYDNALVDAYRENDVKPIIPFVTKKERDKVLVLIDLKKASRLVLECDPPLVTILKVMQPNPNTAVVETEELWSYHDRPLDPGVPNPPHFKARMRLQWTLVKENGQFKVDEGKTLDNTYLEPKGYQVDSLAHGRARYGQAPTATAK